MKTRILSSTLVLLLAVASTAFAAETVHHGSTASSHENNVSQVTAVDSYNSGLASISMESWMDNLDNWEQEGQAPETEVLENTVNFQDWMNALDTWEQGEEPAISENHCGQASVLNEWITSTENWEQR
ncbi:MAG TPA: hypothetical protein PKJ24_01660 [Prolixibacteraceae bacterium]|nr:hypothetical protein [Prolixibacteraceae bacterium]HPT31480.1 hypothetical protein [Prolixibacteraceae bacterium]